jgi:hypothetical protein
MSVVVKKFIEVLHHQVFTSCDSLGRYIYLQIITSFDLTAYQRRALFIPLLLMDVKQDINCLSYTAHKTCVSDRSREEFTPDGTAITDLDAAAILVHIVSGEFATVQAAAFVEACCYMTTGLTDLMLLKQAISSEMERLLVLCAARQSEESLHRNPLKGISRRVSGGYSLKLCTVRFRRSITNPITLQSPYHYQAEVCVWAVLAYPSSFKLRSWQKCIFR